MPLCAAARAGTMAIALAAGACATYESHYVPPADGRWRPVWTGTAVRLERRGPLNRACAADVDRTVDLGAPPYPNHPDRDHSWKPTMPVGAPVVAADRMGASPRVSISEWVPAPYSLPSPSGGGKDTAVVAAVIVLAVLPAVTVGIAVDDPVEDDSTSYALDRANADRDLSRIADSPCARPPEAPR